MDSNKETILDELNDFDKKRPNDISTILESYLGRIAKTGDPMFPWNKLKPLIRRKMELVIAEFHDACPTDTLPPLPNVDIFKYDDLKCKILEAVDSFPNAPFTIQRLCELLTSPKKHYKRTDKFMRGLEKNILVVSTVEPRCTDSHSEVNNNNSLIMNGIIESSAIADMLSAENVSLGSHAVINGAPHLSDSYHTEFSHDPNSVDPTADSESSSSSDSDSSSDSLPPDYAKDGQIESVVDGTNALQVDSAMDASSNVPDQKEEEDIPPSLEVKEEKELLCEDEMNSEDISNLVSSSKSCQPSISKADDVDQEILESSEPLEEIPSSSPVIMKEEGPESEEDGKESPTKMLLMEEVAVSLSEVLDATPEEMPPKQSLFEVKNEMTSTDSNSEPQVEEQNKSEEIEMSNSLQSDCLDTEAKCELDKLEPMEED